MSDKKKSVKTFVIEVDLKTQKNMRSATARLQEAVSLTKAIDLDVIGQEIVVLREIKSGSYLGNGTIERLTEEFKEKNIELVLMDCSLSPIQQRNLGRNCDSHPRCDKGC